MLVIGDFYIYNHHYHIPAYSRPLIFKITTLSGNYNIKGISISYPDMYEDKEYYLNFREWMYDPEFIKEISLGSLLLVSHIKEIHPKYKEEFREFLIRKLGV